MSEYEANRIQTKVLGGTPKSHHICRSCTHSIIRRGVGGQEDLQVCQYISQVSGGRLGRITGPISECSTYYPSGIPTLHDLNQIAWELSIKGTKIGFITPEDRRKAGIGFDGPPR